jgi:pimeloyl-ACP methyl ester carboxylesterase
MPLPPSDAGLVVRRHLAPNHDGWRLALKQTFSPAALRPGRRPLLIVPGFGMNAFIFGYHPRGRSMEVSLAEAGFEVWSVDLRNQGESERDGGSTVYGLRELGLVDVGAAIDHVLAHTETEAEDVAAVGCSLGATLIYLQAALAPAPRIGALVSMGGALRWDEIHPLIRVAFRSPTLVGLIPFAGTRALAAAALPLLTHVPWLLSVYLHPAIVDLSKAQELTRTVENPNRHLNRDLAVWLNQRDVIVDGRNLTTEFAARVRCPLLSVVANADGIVPRGAAMSGHVYGRMAVKEVLEVGTDVVPLAHADLFISDYAEEWLFRPMAEWLARQSDGEALRVVTPAATR